MSAESATASWPAAHPSSQSTQSTQPPRPTQAPHATPAAGAASAPSEQVPLPGARHGRDPARAIKRGPSRVPPEQRAATQRDRLYDGLVHAVAEHGYANATVSDICRAAGVTRPAFYVHFDGKEDAFLATYRHGTRVVFQLMEFEHEQGCDWREGTVGALRVLLDVLAGVPAFATMAIVEIEAVGPAARREREELLRRFAGFFDAAPAPLGPAGAPPPVQPAMLFELLVGGVYAAIYRQVAAGRSAELPRLLPDLVYFVLAPFLGGEAAAAAAAGPGPAGQRVIAPCVAVDPPSAGPSTQSLDPKPTRR